MLLFRAGNADKALMLSAAIRTKKKSGWPENEAAVSLKYLFPHHRKPRPF